MKLDISPAGAKRWALYHKGVPVALVTKIAKRAYRINNEIACHASMDDAASAVWRNVKQYQKAFVVQSYFRDDKPPFARLACRTVLQHFWDSCRHVSQFHLCMIDLELAFARLFRRGAYRRGGFFDSHKIEWR